MKKQKTAINKLLFTAILIMSSFGNANAQDSATIKIDTQNWMIKNLNVSTYRNGDAIPQVQDVTEWNKLETGAWCYYDNDTVNGTTYGKLYNWYAVTDPRGLAPVGYHIPSNTEWTKLTDYLGGEDVAGTKMKSTSGWKENGNGTNESGFAGLPGGCRVLGGGFNNFGSSGEWWSSTECRGFAVGAFYRHLHNGSDCEARGSIGMTYGFSVRCLGD